VPRHLYKVSILPQDHMRFGKWNSVDDYEQVDMHETWPQEYSLVLWPISKNRTL
jgi:hypothetical protein